MYCKRHPAVETRVTCSSCDDPICPDCMIFTAVGAKCPSCARMPKSALVRVKPERLALVAVAGLVSAALGGYLFGIIISAISLLAFLVAFGLGVGVGEAVSWASGRHHSSRLAAWGAACAVFAILFPFLLTGISVYGPAPQVIIFAVTYGGIWKLIWMAAAAFGAWQRNA